MNGNYKQMRKLIDNRDGKGTHHNGRYLESFAMGDNGRQPKRYNWVVVDTITQEAEFFSTKKNAITTTK
tara:strand:+ start:15279 stop:15485 length:207 start_codon:yes stop_codon:yes gene_type:complete